MKQIPKVLLDALIYFERLYWKGDGAKEILQGSFALAMEIEERCNLDWSSVRELVSCIVRDKGFAPDASNEKIYEILNLLGWEVSDEVQESESL